jgi:hypothetical protein
MEGDPGRIAPAGLLMPGRKSRPAKKLCLSLAEAFKNPLN